MSDIRYDMDNIPWDNSDYSGSSNIAPMLYSSASTITALRSTEQTTHLPISHMLNETRTILSKKREHISFNKTNWPILREHVSSKEIFPYLRAFPDKNIKKECRRNGLLREIINIVLFDIEQWFKSNNITFTINTIGHKDVEMPHWYRRIFIINLPQLPLEQRIQVWEELSKLLLDSIDRLAKNQKRHDVSKKIREIGKSTYIEISLD